MSKFQVGDRVVVRDVYGITPDILGMEGPIVQIDHDLCEVSLETETHKRCLWLAYDRLEPIQANTQPVTTIVNIEKRVSEARDDLLKRIFS
jgi:hypothetical protein